MKTQPDEKEDKKAPVQWGLIAGIIVFLAVAIYVVVTVMSGSDPRHKETITTVTLLKPPPPPEIKEKPPEPIKEIKKEEIIDTTPKEQAQGPDKDNAPAGDKLGVDAEGTAGGDNFNLAGRKGGRSLLAGDGGMGRFSLLSKYAGYTKMVENEIRKKVMKRLDEEGGVPKGKLQAIVRLSVDNNGFVVNYKIIGSSGNHKMDDAVNMSVKNVKISSPPPDGMPKTMDVRITYQG